MAEANSTYDEETYTVIYAVSDLSIRAALLRLFGTIRNERVLLNQRLAPLEADQRTQKLIESFFRWAVPIGVAVVLGLVR